MVTLYVKCYIIGCGPLIQCGTFAIMLLASLTNASLEYIVMIIIIINFHLIRDFVSLVYTCFQKFVTVICYSQYIRKGTTHFAFTVILGLIIAVTS